jgi:hypothetical protein
MGFSFLQFLMRKGDFFISDQMSLASAHLMSLT